MEELKVQLIFTEKTSHGDYRDALYYPYEKFDIDKQREEIEQEKKSRVDNWVYILEHPPVEVEPTKEELEAQVVELQTQKMNIDAQIVEKQAKISEKTVIIKG
jgi:hypothetical protein